MLAFYENRENAFVCHFSNNLNFEAHLHKQVELIYVENGEIDITVNQITYKVTSGGLLIVFPNTIHSYKTNKQCSHVMLIFDINLAGDYSNKLTHYECENPILNSDEIHSDILYCIKSLKEQENFNIETGILKGYVSIILGRIFEKIILKKSDSSNSNLMHKMLVYITENFNEPITIESVAKNIGSSKYYLSRIFSAKIGVSFNNYVNSLRIGQARHLLENSDQSILDIAYESGFDSQRTFNRAFKALCNTTPKEYRRNFTENTKVKT